ncbi:glutaredoxin, GrxB family [Brenneria goodwinii]|uniref:Glutaredoxin 2 n=1 Tax=Brenneria goodwinii TaxID=1109412 RepID=A0A0G4JXV6_9GAMM|nr:glutaredoxin 2 [Brenneria goodwinii]ATA23230.1 glutaredoxin 2 [Brenneria goodwinii]MCG8157622.1 glutaredoxin 2 [Brenneria goodwinii]MCG8161893.1 glutaredoxin 2 [Brenneria goodwinii]MCG8168346.1 glutaredoxin 2 [Brenneria goodwinii]MCG8172979.1 glutaredoxin 2 [Brenneria goodwinii]
MKLFIYEHCPFCVRARMIFGLKAIPFELSVIMEGDVETPTRMVGRKVVPILQKEDGSFMPESMDIVHYVDNTKAPLIADKPVAAAIEAWCKAASDVVFNLAVPRFTKAEFKELSTPEAREAYRLREEKAFGDLAALIAKTPTLVAEAQQKLAELEPLLANEQDISTTDFILFPVLRSLTIVKNISFGPNVSRYLKRVADASKVDLLTHQAI